MGRPRKHLDDAAKSAAYRERVANQAALADMALTILRQPTLKLVAHIAQTMAEKADDKATMAASIAEAMLAGLQRGGGANCADAARNVLRYPAPSTQDLATALNLRGIKPRQPNNYASRAEGAPTTLEAPL